MELVNEDGESWILCEDCDDGCGSIDVSV